MLLHPHLPLRRHQVVRFHRNKPQVRRRRRHQVSIPKVKIINYFAMRLRLPQNLLCPQPPCLPTITPRNKSTETGSTHCPLLKGLTIFLPPSPIRPFKRNQKPGPFFIPLLPLRSRLLLLPLEGQR